MSKFSTWLSDAMYQHGGRKYGGAALARDLSVRRATVSAWLNDQDVPRREHIAKLALHFGTTSRHLYGLLGIAPPEDLNDVIEQVNHIMHELTAADQRKILSELQGKYGKKS